MSTENTGSPRDAAANFIGQNARLSFLTTRERGFTLEFQKDMTALAAAMKKKVPYKQLRSMDIKASKSCNARHEAFREE